MMPCQPDELCLARGVNSFTGLPMYQGTHTEKARAQIWYWMPAWKGLSTAPGLRSGVWIAAAYRDVAAMAPVVSLQDQEADILARYATASRGPKLKKDCFTWLKAFFLSLAAVPAPR